MRALKFALALGAVGVVATTSPEPSRHHRDRRWPCDGMLCDRRISATPSRPIDICTRALSNQALSVRDRAATYVNRSVIRLRVRDFTGAIADVDQSIQRWPQLSEPYVNRGAALINLERPQEALTELDKAITMGLEKVHLAYYNRGLAKEKLNDARGAYADYRKALELDPNFTLASNSCSASS